MSDDTDGFVVGLTAGSGYDLSIEEEVFDGMDVSFRPVDVETAAELREELAGVDAVIDRLLSAPYTAEVIESLAGCRVVARCGIGVDAIDCEAAERAGMYVVNVPSYCEDEVSEHAIMLVLALERRLLAYDRTLREGRWEKGIGEVPVRRLRGRTLGLVGFGTIARLVAEKARAFGMRVVAADPYVDEAEMNAVGVTKRSFEEVLEAADVVSVHVPLTDETAGLFDRDAFARMRDDAFFVNVARGGLVVEEDLARALDEGELAGAGLDVFAEEPSDRFDGTAPAFDTPVRGHDNVILTPHVAWYSVEANDEKRRTAAMDVRRILEGSEPENAVARPGGS